MADQRSLQFIGVGFGVITALVLVIATVAVASADRNAGEHPVATGQCSVDRDMNTRTAKFTKLVRAAPARGFRRNFAGDELCSPAAGSNATWLF